MCIYSDKDLLGWYVRTLDLLSKFTAWRFAKGRKLVSFSSHLWRLLITTAVRSNTMGQAFRLECFPQTFFCHKQEHDWTATTYSREQPSAGAISQGLETCRHVYRTPALTTVHPLGVYSMPLS
jgi:hypothetical protein